MTSDSDFARQDDPLGAIGASLTAAARRRSARLRRRRRGLFATTATAATLAVTGAAFAVTGTSTGIPALDRLIGEQAADDPWKGTDRLDTGAPPPKYDRRPLGGLSPTVEIPLPDGRHLAAAGYETRDGMICSATVDPADDSVKPRGGAGCTNIRILKRELRSRPARIGGGGGSPISPDRYGVHVGVARGDVVGVTVGISGKPPVEAVVSGPWRPPSWNGAPLRVFFAVLPTPPRDVIRSGGFHRWFPTAIAARLADGTIVDLSGPTDKTPPRSRPSNETPPPSRPSNETRP